MAADRRNRQLEVCVDSVESAMNAISGGSRFLLFLFKPLPTGADRLELCASLSLGGLTPTLGQLVAVKAEMSRLKCRAVPIFCMLRCRAGDFVYDETEMTVMLYDLDHLK